VKAIIEVTKAGSIFATAARQLAEARAGRSPDYRLGFESAKSLFAEITPARLDLLDNLRRAGPCSVARLAAALGGDAGQVAAETSRLAELGLVERGPDGTVAVPFDAIEILLPLARAA
jgi:predicted transcriptional regulator